MAALGRESNSSFPQQYAQLYFSLCRVGAGIFPGSILFSFGGPPRILPDLTSEGIGMEKSANGFPLKRNADDTFSSICPKCFQTVARDTTRNEVEAAERFHSCSESDLISASLAKEAIRSDL
jgi:hypothetical protein